MTPSPPEDDVRELLARHGIDLILTVPCKYIANLITDLEADARFEVVYPTREEEGLGIAAGAHLAGRRPALLIQNSGLGNLVNAHCSLNQFYGIPVCMIISHRGDELERVPAQRPMGSVSRDLLQLMHIECVELRTPADLPRVHEGLRRYVEKGESVAFLGKKTFWTV
jgi:sulfopyruvate decarboxylase subunit alpha